MTRRSHPTQNADRLIRARARRLRAAAVTAVRTFFRDRGFLEVDTPLLVEAPGSESQLDPFGVRATDVGGTRWLISSPEHHMKRLLVDGEEKIVQVCRCLRGGEHTPHHREEFTMVEWYRRGADYGQLCRDVEELVHFVAHTCLGRSTVVGPDDVTVDLSPPWDRWTVHDAIQHFAGVRLTDPTDPATLRRGALAAGITSITPDDDWETAFYKLLLEKVEPALARTGRGVHLLDWPAPMAALARLKQDDPSVAERVESYAGGLELSNGFSELVDPRVQRRRFGEERRRRRARGAQVHPVDERFLRALAFGMPPSAGVALGFDRLLLLVSEGQDIGAVSPHFMERREAV